MCGRAGRPDGYAAAMVGPHERAAHDNPAATATMGDEGYVRIGQLSSSPEADWNNGEIKKISVFSTSGNAHGSSQFGADAR